MSGLLWLSDASPLFFYSPSSVYFSGTTSQSSWTGSVDQSAAAPNNSFHITTGSAGVILPSIYATSFMPIWSESDSPSYTVLLGVGTSPPKTWTSGLNYTDFTDFNSQTFTITVACPTTQCPNDQFGFRGAWVGTQWAPEGSVLDQVILDDSSSAVTYSGFAPMSTVSTNTGISIDPSDHGGSLSSTSNAGASASITFTGASIVVTGVTGPMTGLYSATLDGSVVATLDGHNDVVNHGIIIFFATNLDTSKSHTLVLTALEGSPGGSTGLIIDSWTAYGSRGSVGFVGATGGVVTVGPSASLTPVTGGPTAVLPTTTVSGSPTPIGNQATRGGSPNAGVIIGAILGVLAGLFLLLWIFRRVSPAFKKKEKKLDPWDEANLLQNMKNEEIHITTVAKQRYVYPGLIAQSKLKK